jgi:hypothetical protein
MKNNILKYLLVVLIASSFTACLKSNPYFEDFSSTQPIADIPKAPANALLAAAATNSWEILDTLANGVDYKTAVHISAKDHIGDVAVKMKIDSVGAKNWIAAHPTLGYKLIPDSLYTVSSSTVLIPNAGVFSTGDFVVHIKSNAKDAGGNKLFKTNKYLLPVSIESASGYGIASNFQTVLWYIRVK